MPLAEAMVGSNSKTTTALAAVGGVCLSFRVCMCALLEQSDRVYIPPASIQPCTSLILLSLNFSLLFYDAIHNIITINVIISNNNSVINSLIWDSSQSTVSAGSTLSASTHLARCSSLME